MAPRRRPPALKGAEARPPGGPRDGDASSADGDTIARNTAFALLTQFATAAFTAGLTLYLVRALEPAGYGLFALAVGIGTLMLLPSDFGISSSAARFIADHRGDPAALPAVLASALRLKLMAAGGVSIALFAAAGPIAALYDNPDLAWPLRGVAIALFGQSLLLLFSGSFVALGRAAINFRVVLSESAMEASASLALVLLGAGATGAAFGRATGYLFGAAMAVALAARLFGRRALSLSRRNRAGAGQIARYAGALLIIDGAYTLFGQIDVLLIGAYLGAASVGVFQAPVRLVTFLHYPGYALSSGVAPRLSRGAGQTPNVDAFRAGIRYLIIFQAALVAPIALWSEPIAELLLGAGYEESADVLRALAPFVFLAGLAPLVSVGVNYLGEARRRIPIAIGAVLINLGIDLVLIPEIGVVGAAIGTDVAYAFYVAGHLWVCKTILDLPLRPIALTFARAMAAAGAMAAAMALLGTTSLSLLEWVAGGAAGALAFCLTLIVTREVSIAELVRARRAAWRRIPRFAR